MLEQISTKTELYSFCPECFTKSFHLAADDEYFCTRCGLHYSALEALEYLLGLATGPVLLKDNGEFIIPLSRKDQKK